MKNLEMLLVEIFPENEIKVEVQSGKIVINVDNNKIKIKIPETDPDLIALQKVYPDVDFSMEYTQLIVDEIKKCLRI